MLQVNPDSRPHVEDIHAELVALASDKDINLKAPIVVSNRVLAVINKRWLKYFPVTFLVERFLNFQPQSPTAIHFPSLTKKVFL